MHRKKRQNISLLMAGWLFADLLLALFVVGLGSEAFAYPITTIIWAPQIIPYTPAPEEPRLELKPICIKVPSVTASAADSKDLTKKVLDTLDDDKNKRFNTSVNDGDKAGLVLLWGVSDYDSKTGQDYSNKVKGILEGDTFKYYNYFKDSATPRALWTGIGGRPSGPCKEYVNKRSEGEVILEIYFTKSRTKNK
ncbi:MAG: hypothetical protein LBU38_02975 [Propionibacteriaceae bacterium]|jgi:hypothetical protein|nr:hypothetical protein [Propionibacteriaceae bacterium]